MIQRDYLLREIERMGTIISSIRQKKSKTYSLEREGKNNEYQ